MHKLALVAFMTACTTGLSWTGGMQGGTRTTASNSSPTPAILPSTGHPFDVNSDCFGEHGRVDYHRDPDLLWPCFDYADDKAPPSTASSGPLVHTTFMYDIASTAARPRASLVWIHWD